MKLLVSWMRELSTYISREFFHVMQDLIHVHGWRQVEPALLAADTAHSRATILRVLGEIPEVILFWEAFDLCIAMQPALDDLACRACLFADDLHQLWGSEGLRAMKLRAFSACHTILSPYAPVFPAFYPELDGRASVVWAPHAASPDFELPFNASPDNEILLSGAVGVMYPIRGRMKDLQEEGRFAIAHRAHPGYGGAYDYEKDRRIGQGYARTINRYRAAVTDASTFGYIVAKHFEIPATGSLLMTDAAAAGQLSRLGFMPRRHYLPVTLDRLEEQLEYVVDPRNRDETDAIRRNGRELVLARHRTSHRARLIDAACTGREVAV